MQNSYGKDIIFLDRLIEENHESQPLENYTRYKWLDVKDYANKLFNEYPFEMPWAEDMWNIFIYGGPVNSTQVAIRHEDQEIVDMILWLMAMYDLYFEYKVAAH